MWSINLHVQHQEADELHELPVVDSVVTSAHQIRQHFGKQDLAGALA
jgi:hypothetical protein